MSAPWIRGQQWEVFATLDVINWTALLLMAIRG
jgi:hypothetical protein